MDKIPLKYRAKNWWLKVTKQPYRYSEFKFEDHSEFYKVSLADLVSVELTPDKLADIFGLPRHIFTQDPVKAEMEVKTI